MYFYAKTLGRLPSILFFAISAAALVIAFADACIASRLFAMLGLSMPADLRVVDICFN